MRYALVLAAAGIFAVTSAAHAGLTFAHDFETGDILQAESGQTLVAIPPSGAVLDNGTSINGNNSANFDAGGFGIANASILNKSVGTFEAWVDLSDGTAGLATNSLFGSQVLMDWQGTSFSANHITVGLGEYAGNVYVRTDVYDNASQWGYNYGVITPGNDGWTHIAVTWDFDTAGVAQDYLRVYVNGSQAFDLTGLDYTMVEASDQVSFGTTWSRNATRDLQKTVDRLRLYDTTIGDVYDLTGGSFTPSTDAVPEPSVLGLASAGAALLLRRRR